MSIQRWCDEGEGEEGGELELITTCRMKECCSASSGVILFDGSFTNTYTITSTKAVIRVQNEMHRTWLQ